MDDLLDLNWSSSPSTDKPAAPTKPASPAAFDFLSKPANNNGPNYYSSTPPLRPSTPSTAPLPSKPQIPSALRPTSGTSTPNVPAPPSDAFSSLLSLDTAGPSKTLSLAERQAQMAEDKRKKAEHERQQFEAHGNFWDNLGSGSTLKPTLAPVSRPTSALSNQASGNASKASSTVWDTEDFLSTPSSSKPNSSVPKAAPSPFDFDALESSADHLGQSQATSSGMRTPVSNFDFGDDDDNLLGELGKPSKPRVSVKAQPKSPPKSRPLRTSSPPPHIIGQIVEMGFSPAQARSALANTASGLDVQAALETLLNSQPQAEEDVVLQEQQGREEEERERRRRRRAGPSRETVKARSKEEVEQDIYTQANEFKQTFISGVSSLWATGKERVSKAYEEQRKAMDNDRGRGPTKDGRPRWMQEAEAAERDETPAAGPSFKDSNEEENTNGRAPASRQANGQRAAKPTRENLFADDEPSPPLQQHLRHPQVPRSRAPTPVPRTATPLIRRTLVTANPSSESTASKYKSHGNDHFKLGRFAEAEQAYSSAISALPDGHLLLIPLYNNRAATRLKLGESASAAADCTIVLESIGLSYHPSKEAPLPPELAEVKLSDSLVKALSKRAQAWEMGEKWSKAAEDWEKIMGLDVALLGTAAAATRNLAADGARRARRGLEGENKPNLKSKPPAAKPSKTLDVSKSAAVSELRKANQAAEAEDTQRLAVKDSVDAKVVAWKGGKETNLRALIASLDTILWDGILFGGLKVGMHELITEKQVKIKYMKVIARLHPDKLDVKGTTVEQRMLANAAFSALNDAWQAFNS